MIKINNHTGQITLNVKKIDRDLKSKFDNEMTAINPDNYRRNHAKFKVVLKTSKFWTTIPCNLNFYTSIFYTNNNTFSGNDFSQFFIKDKINFINESNKKNSKLTRSLSAETIEIHVDKLSALTIGAPIARIGTTAQNADNYILRKYFIDNKSVVQIDRQSGIITLNAPSYLTLNTKESSYILLNKVKQIDSVLLNVKIQNNYFDGQINHLQNQIRINFPDDQVNDNFKLKQTLIIDNITLYTDNDVLTNLNPKNVSYILFYSKQNNFVEVLINGNIIIKSLKVLKKLKFFNLPILIQNLKSDSTYLTELNFVLTVSKFIN